jgi:hypothetical protein
MKMPGFTAEASLRETGTTIYLTEATPFYNGSVVPALCICGCNEFSCGCKCFVRGGPLPK